MIIIGILAAIAIPVFLNQRKSGYDAGAKSDVKNAATAEETYYTDSTATPAAYLAGAYVQTPASNTLTALPGWKPSAHTTAVTISLVTGGYMIVGTSESTKNFCYNSTASDKGVTQASTC
jgi:type IV pilus assembly protein PilA